VALCDAKSCHPARRQSPALFSSAEIALFSFSSIAPILLDPLLFTVYYSSTVVLLSLAVGLLYCNLATVLALQSVNTTPLAPFVGSNCVCVFRACLMKVRATPPVKMNAAAVAPVPVPVPVISEEVAKERPHSVHTKVYKEFPGYGWFWGTVTAVDNDSGLHHIVYTDGDSEDLDHQEVTPWVHIALSLPFHHSTGQAPPSKATRTAARSSQNSDPVNNNNNNDRRSKRLRVSTLLYIDGHAVKKDNNYVLKGHSYQFGVVPVHQDEPQKKRKTTQRVTATNPKKPPRTFSAVETTRVQLRQRIQANICDKARARRSFLRLHAAALEPFLDPTVSKQIASSSTRKVTV